MSNKNVAFLLGSGTSVSIGMPSTSDITELILSEDYFRNATRSIPIHPNDLSPIKEVTFSEIPYFTEVLELISRLKSFLDSYNVHTFPNRMMREERKRDINYEDFHYMLIQMHDHSIKSPNIIGSILYQSIIDSAFEDRIQRALDDCSHITADHNICNFIANAAKYNFHSVESILTRKQNFISSKQIDKLKIFVDAFEDRDILVRNIFTLNHDNIIEKLFKSNNIMYCDGHEETEGKSELRRWRPTLFDNTISSNTNIVRLIKLHGTLGRRYFHPVEENTGPPELAIYTGEQSFDKTHNKVRAVDGIEYEFPDSSKILIGTENKAREMLVTDLWELFSRFRRYLFNEVDIVVACGYSFGDEHINAQILEWLINTNNKKLIIVNYEDQTSFQWRLDESMRHRLYALNGDKYQYIKSDIKELSWDSLKANII